MRAFFNLSGFSFMWLSLVSGSAQLNMDIKFICDGRPIQCVCNHGAEPCTGSYYNFGLTLDRKKYEDKSLQSIMEAHIASVIHKFQRVGVLNFRSNLQLSSMRLIRKDSPHDEGTACRVLWQASLGNILNQIEAMKSLALELNLMDVTCRENSCDGDVFSCR